MAPARIEFAVGLSVLALSAAACARDEDRVACISGYKPDRQISACTAVISSALESRVTVAIAYMRRGGAYFRKKNYAAAIADYSEAIRMRPGFADAWNNRCAARAADRRDLELALADCNRAVQLESAPNTLDTRGDLYVQMERYKDAVADFDAAVRQQTPVQAGTLYKRGMAKLRLGDKAGGEDDIAAAKRLER
jgi:tetratricopeptide (TPR) repeat protein